MRGIGGSRWQLGAALSLVALTLALAVGSAGADRGSTTASASAARAKVTIKGFEYKPAALRTRPGTKVVFVNRDSAPHTATRRGSFDTGTLRKGKAATVRFKRRGTYRYICTIHPFMRGKIVVR